MLMVAAAAAKEESSRFPISGLDEPSEHEIAPIAESHLQFLFKILM